MAKIENVINHCTECRYCSKYEKNASQIFICEHNPEGDHIPKAPFLIVAKYGRIGDKINIPDNCPLETYNNE